MYNTVRAAYGCFRKHNILARSYLLYKYSSKFSHNFNPFFSKKIAAGFPAAVVKIGTGPNM